MDVKYIGRANRRVIRDIDMVAQGIEGFTTTTWTKLPPGNVQSVIDPAGDWLTTHLSIEFEKVEPEAPATLSARKSSSASSSSTDTASSSK